MFTKYKIIIMFALALSVVSAIGYLKVDNMKLERVVSEQSMLIDELHATQTRLRSLIDSKDALIEDWRTVYIEQSLYRKELQHDLDTIRKTLDGYKDRQGVVYKKPGLVEIKEQKALDAFFDEVQGEN